jgi:HK97 family phage major capsid protein
MNLLKKLKAEYDDILQKMSALVEAEGDMTDEQKTQFDALKAQADAKKAQIDKVESVERMKAESANIGKVPEYPAMKDKPYTADIQDSEPAPVKIPATVKRFGKLKAFGKDDEQAYSFGQWLRACNGIQSAAEWCKNHGIVLATTQSEGSNTTGGYLVPTQFDNTLIDLRNQYGVFRQNVGIKYMTSDVMLIPRRATGLTGYWVGEGSAITQSNKTWDQVQLTAKKLAAVATMTSELSEDAIIMVADDLASEIAYVFAYNEDLAGFIGDGTSTYGGITGVTTALKAAAGTPTTSSAGGVVIANGNTFAEITLANFNGVLGVLPGYARAGAKWYCSPMFHEAVMNRLAYASGGVPASEIINGVTVPKFLGYPVVLSDVLPSTDANSQICCLFGNLPMAAKLGDRRQTSLAFSDSAYVGSVSMFETDQIAVRGTERIDIVVHDVGSTSAAGPIVGLQTLNS